MGAAIRGSTLLVLAVLAAGPLTTECAGNTEDIAEGGKGQGATIGKGGSSGSTGGKWPDGGGAKGGSGGTGGTTGGTSSGGASGGIGGGSGGSGATGGSGASGGTGATGGSGASGGTTGGGGGTATELCNNKDDNGNGQVDENLSQACTTACGSGTQTCSAGVWGACSSGLPKTCLNYSTCQNESKCVASCPGAPSESCNLKDDNCNGKCDDSANCRVGVYRSYNGSTGEHFYTTSSTEAACCGFTIEFPNFYYLYKSQLSGLVPFYRCYLTIGKHFYTTSSSCEGAGTNEGALGYIASSAVCGATPLYRLWLSNGDHFYTTSSSEKDSAVSMGYVYESIAGYVWTGA